MDDRINVPHGNIMRFNRAYFESILPRRRSTGEPLWTRAFYQGEWVYTIEFDDPDDVRIMVRSSIDQTEFSASTGRDSIRTWLIVGDDPGMVVSAKVKNLIKRTPGWEKNLYSHFSTLREWRERAGNCRVCGAPRRIFKVKKKGSYQGKVCATHCQADKFVVVADKP